MLETEPDQVEFDGKRVYQLNGEGEVSLEAVAAKGTSGNNTSLQASATRSSQISPPPFMAGIVEIEIDKETGALEILDYAAVVDCGTPVNPNLARVQTEGGLAQGIGMALYEDIPYNDRGQMRNNSFMQYKIPAPYRSEKYPGRIYSKLRKEPSIWRQVHWRNGDQYPLPGYCKRRIQRSGRPYPGDADHFGKDRHGTG